MSAATKMKHPFLIRMLLTTLTVCLIPMFFLSIRYFRTQRESMQSAEKTRLHDTADRVASQLDRFMLSIESLQYQHRKLQRLSDATMKSGVSAEIEAIEMLGILTNNHTFLYDNGLILLGDSNCVYVSKGKYQLKYFCQEVFGITEQAFLQKAEELSVPVFLPWNPGRMNVIYLYPEHRINQLSPNRISIYIISKSSLLSALGHLLTDGCELDMITDAQGQLLYHSGSAGTAALWEDEGTSGQTVWRIDGRSVYRDRAVSASGLSVYLHKSESAVFQKLQQEASSLTLVLSGIAMLTVLCALLAVWYNYKPIKQVISEIGEEGTSRSKGEIHYLYDAYSHQKGERQKLENKLDVQRKMILDRIYKCLLNGRPLSNQEFELLHWQNKFFFVAATDILNTGLLVPELVQRLSDAHFIRVIDMKADRLSVFICTPNDSTRQEQMRLIQIIQRFLPPGIRLGVSRTFRTLEEYPAAYTESVLAEQSCMENGVYFAEDLPQHRGVLFFENNFDSLQFINQLRNNDEAAIKSVRQMTQKIEWSAKGNNLHRYSEFQLMEYLRNAFSKVGVIYDIDRFAQILGIPDPNLRKEAICQLVRDALKQHEEQLLIERDQLSQEMMLYIEEHFCNSEFSLEMLAERFELSVPSVSRIFKEVTGSNFKKYVNERRLNQAKLLLGTTQDSIAVIAEKTGFSSASYFIQVFKSAEGVTPAHWRDSRQPR